MCVFVCGWKAGVCVSHASRSPDKIWAVFLIRSCRELWSLFSPQLNDTASCKKGASNQFVINAVEFLSLPAVFHSPPPPTQTMKALRFICSLPRLLMCHCGFNRKLTARFARLPAQEWKIYFHHGGRKEVYSGDTWEGLASLFDW